MALIILAGMTTGFAAEPPEISVTNIRRAFHNGEHNAFTDLVRFGDKYFLTFRSCPDGHMVHPTSRIIILSSPDAEHWDLVHEFHVPLRDTRDPHFLVFAGKLFVYTGTWYSGATTLPRDQYELNLHLGYAVSTADGSTWTEPIMLEGTFGHYIWRAASFDGKAYLCGRRKQGFRVGPKGEGADVESMMLESDDGLRWRTRAMFQAERGDETAFLFEDNGNIVAIGRRGSAAAQLLRSQPPYDDWQRTELDRYIGGPLIKRWGDHYVVGGRKIVKGKGARTSMCWLIDDQLREFAELPSAGDNSYPGLVVISDQHALMSWYSSHETDASGKPITAIYLADLEMDSP